jgi:hypothetical protein
MHHSWHIASIQRAEPMISDPKVFDPKGAESDESG